MIYQKKKISKGQEQNPKQTTSISVNITVTLLSVSRFPQVLHYCPGKPYGAISFFSIKIGLT